MKEQLMHFVPLITLIRVNDHITDCEWECIEFMDLNFDEEGESIALCDGKGYYIKNKKVDQLFKLARKGSYKICMDGYSSM